MAPFSGPGSRTEALRVVVPRSGTLMKRAWGRDG
jgi:hypothetical protein